MMGVLSKGGEKTMLCMIEEETSIPRILRNAGKSQKLKKKKRQENIPEPPTSIFQNTE